MSKIICFEWTDFEYSLNKIYIAIDKELTFEQISELKKLIKEHIEDNDVDIDDGYILEVCEIYLKDIGAKILPDVADYIINFDC